MAGRTLLHYEIIERIGAGGMGEVWRARDTRLDRDVAIKILPPDHAHTEVQKQRFLREARAASALVHPNIITVHEINSADGTDFIVMEFVRGETLSALLSHGRLPQPQAMGVATQILEALKTAHDAGVVHRDLKPGNIMMSASGLVKVLDFGLAKRIAPADGNPSRQDTTSPGQLTVAGATLGTPAYMSPEQAVGDPVDARSDVFSFGVVLYEMLAGVKPFQGESNLTLLRHIVHEPPRPIRDLAAGVPSAVAAIADRCLAKEPADRYPNAGAVLDALRRIPLASASAAITDDAGLTRADPSVPAVSIEAPHKLRRRRRWMPLAIIMSLILLGQINRLRHRLSEAAAPGPSATGADASASPQDLYQRATDRLRAYYREGNVDAAIAELTLALQKRPSYPLAEARLSLAYWRKNAISPDTHWKDQALAHAQRAVRDDAQLALAHIADGAALATAGQMDAAGAAYNRALTLDPMNVELAWRMGEYALSRKDTALAQQFFRRAVDAGPQEWEPHLRLGVFYYRQGRYEDALKAYEKARDLAPDSPRVYSNLGAVLHQLDRTDEAARALQRSLEIAPESITYSNLGTLLYFQGHYPEAVSAFERSVQSGANTYLRWGNLADAQRMVDGAGGRAHESYATAVRLARESLAENPDDTDARSGLALYLIRD